MSVRYLRKVISSKQCNKTHLSITLDGKATQKGDVESSSSTGPQLKVRKWESSIKCGFASAHL